MWSLPDIKLLNAHAADNRRKIERETNLKTSRKHHCENCGKPSTHHLKWFDIFSDDPKGVSHFCDVCFDQGADSNGFFECDHCQRCVADHYTWERYQTNLGDTSLCLKCAAEQYFADTANWIDPANVKEIISPSRGASSPLFSDGKLNFGRCKHVLGVGQTPPPGIKFHDNAEFDSLDGHQISGRNLQDLIRELHEPFCPVLDAAYQFAVSIGIYVRRSAETQLREAA
ncbi:MAG TPA: hypothetical protein VGO67_15070 [Verrucomicrobiae bacterium]|jgi:hypothetical protein